ncbi:MAG: hypothetical protein LBE49_03125 [Deltaproteobacteria bacterium]|jgi:hypothetical protein|nr:hypothetical protein [Deltaproteobacteria bacterium]
MLEYLSLEETLERRGMANFFMRRALPAYFELAEVKLERFEKIFKLGAEVGVSKEEIMAEFAKWQNDNAAESSSDSGKTSV